MKREKLWNPRAKNCWSCSELKPIRDKKSGSVDFEKKLCEKFGWEITNDLAKRQAVCRIRKEGRRLRKR